MPVCEALGRSSVQPENKMPNRGMPTLVPSTRMDGLICAAWFAAIIPPKLLLYRYL